MLSTIWQDIRYGIRVLFKNPGVTAVAVITLALGIGANTAIFSVVSAVMLRPLPYHNPDRLVALWESSPARGPRRVTPANFFDWQQQNTSFAAIAPFGFSTMTLTGDGEPEQMLGTRAGAGYFGVVGVEPMLGRSFLAEEHQPGKGNVVILGHDFWQRRYGGNAGIVNKAITLDGNSYTVIGVMPAGIFPVWATTSGKISFNSNEQQFWLPMSFSSQWAGNRTAHVLGVVGRLNDNVSIEQARAEMNTIGTRLEQEYAANKGAGIIVNPFMNEVVGNVRPALLTLLGSVGVVLLIACANIAGLLLAQHATRSKEVAVRSALGAGRVRLIRQFAIEGLILSLLGTAAGVFLAWLSIDAIVKLDPARFPRFNQTQLDLPVLGFTIMLSLVTCLLFGLIPAWQASKPDLQSTLEQGHRVAGPGVGGQRFRQLLVVFQISMAVVLVISAGLLVKSYWRLLQVDPGFRPERILKASLTLPPAKYGDAPQINAFYNQLIERVSALPEVESATIAYDHPLEANWVDTFAIVGRPQGSELGSADFHAVGWDYFHTVGTALVSGRQFTAKDDPDHPGVVIVNEAFVRKYFPHEPAMGQQLRLSPPARIWQNQRLTSFEVVGVARDVKSAGLNGASEPAYYVPATQAPLPDMNVLVRTRSEPNAFLPTLRNTVLALDPNQPITSVTTMEEIVSSSIAQPRLSMLLMGLFGVLALLLAAVGIYGLLSYTVTQRTQEMGIRMALGAQVKHVLTLVLRQGVALVLIGEGLGLLGAFALTRLLRSLLFGVTPTDAATFCLVSVALTAVALLACYIPARRATKVDPLVALRYE